MFNVHMVSQGTQATKIFSFVCSIQQLKDSRAKIPKSLFIVLLQIQMAADIQPPYNTKEKVGGLLEGGSHLVMSVSQGKL